jgi:hypothetical protein
MSSNGGTLANIWLKDSNIIAATSGSGYSGDCIFAENSLTGTGGINHVWIINNKVDCTGATASTNSQVGIRVHGTNANEDVGQFTIDNNDILAPGNTSNHGFCVETGSFVSSGNGPQPHNFSITNNKCTLTAGTTANPSVGGFSMGSCSYCTISGNSVNPNGFVGNNTAFEDVFSEHSAWIGNTVQCQSNSANGFPSLMSLTEPNFDVISGNALCGMIAGSGNEGIHMTHFETSAGSLSSITSSGNTYTFTFTTALSGSTANGQYAQGSWFQISGCSTSGFNGIWQVVTGGTASISAVLPSSSLGTTKTGCSVNASASYNVISNNVITLANTTTATVEAVVLQATVAGAMQNNAITGNIVYGNNSGSGQQGIVVTNSGGLASATGTIVTGNQVNGVSTGVLIGASVANTFIKNNNVVNATTTLNASSATLASTDIPTAFANLAACSSSLEGDTAAVNDNNTAVAWGSTITGGGTGASAHVMGYCDGTNWTIAAK